MDYELPRRIALFTPWTWKRRWMVVTTLLTAFVAYPLSYGPAWLAVYHGWMPNAFFHAFYEPLMVIVDSNETLSILFWDGYVAFFIERRR